MHKVQVHCVWFRSCFLLQMLSDSSLRADHVLLMLLVQYRKYESTNPYIVSLSILDSDIALNVCT